MDNIKQFFLKYKIYIAVIVILICILFSFILYNPFKKQQSNLTTKTDLNKPSLEVKNSSPLIPVTEDLNGDIDTAKEQFLKIQEFKDTIIKKAIGSDIKIPVNITDKEAGIINSNVIPQAYIYVNLGITELQQLFGSKDVSSDIEGGDQFRVKNVNRQTALYNLRRFFSDLSKQNNLGYYSIDEYGEQLYISNFGTEYKKPAYRDTATHIVYTYKLSANNTPILLGNDVITFMFIEDIKTGLSEVTVYNFFPLSVGKVGLYLMQSGTYNFSPLVSIDPLFNSFYTNNAVSFLKNDFSISSNYVKIGYMVDLKNKFLVPVVLKESYLTDKVYSKLNNKSYILVTN